MLNLKYVVFGDYIGDYKVEFLVDKYANNGRLALMLFSYDEEEECMEDFCDVTVNLPEYSLSDENCAFLDTNNAPYILNFLLDNKLGELTGRQPQSGFCTYPEFRFDMEKIAEHALQEI